MLELCRERAEREGVPAPNLYAQAMHELDLPRRYRTIVCCGGFGLGSSRAQDLEGLRRLHEHLDPGGSLVIDNEVPYAAAGWRFWPKSARAELPRAWHDEGDKKVTADGSEIELLSRIVDVDPLEQSVTLQMRAFLRRDGEVVAEEEHLLTMNLYFAHELKMLLERAGFSDVEVRAGYEDRPPTGDDEFVVFVASRT
jgi:hypothetical protein